MQAKQVFVDVEKTIGNKLWLSEIRPNKLYADGKPTGETDGFRYDVFAVERNMLKLSVVIPGKQLLNEPNNEYIEVAFSDLELMPYVDNNRQIQFKASASGIVAVNKNK